MNREYNDNREYKNALDELHFSEEAKNRMVERLMERAEQPAPRRVRRFPRIAAVGVAAALVLSIGAGASGVLKSPRSSTRSAVPSARATPRTA